MLANDAASDTICSAANGRLADAARLAACLCDVSASLILPPGNGPPVVHVRNGIDVGDLGAADSASLAAQHRGADIVIIRDARLDGALQNHPWVAGKPFIRLVATAPLLDPTGVERGLLCLVDQRARSLSAEQQAALLALARQTAALAGHAPATNSPTATLRKFLRHAPVALAMFDRDMRCMEASQHWISGLGADIPGACEQPSAAVPADLPETWHAACQRGLSGETVHVDEDRWVGSDGTTRWYRWELRPWHGDDGRIGGVVIFAEDITEIKQAQQRTDSVQRQFRHLFESAPDAIIMVDRTGRIRLANRKTEDLFGYGVNELVKQPVEILINTAARHRHKALRQSFIKSKKQSAMGNTRDTLKGQHRDGSSFPVEISLSRFIGDGDEYIIASVRDVSARLQAQADRMARQVAEEASQAKSLFLATMSHEIRTPLSAVVSLAEVMSQSELSHDQVQLLDTMHDSAGHLLRLIDDVLDFSKIEAGSLEIEQAPVDLHDVIESVARGLATHALAQGVALRLFVAPEVPGAILSDDVRLRQILFNLLGNAIKFSAGSVGKAGRTSLRAEMEAGGSSVLRLEIADNGIGMAPDMLDTLFQPFTQGEASTTRKFGGTGLGLSICKRIIDRIGGTIALQSEPGKGTVFTVRLPVTAAPHSSGQAPARLAGLTCLLAASEVYERRDLQRYLEHEGARVIAPGSVSWQGRKWQNAPDVVLISGAAEPAPDGIPASLPRVLVGNNDSGRLSILGRGKVLVGSCAMTRTELTNAVALAGGRESLAANTNDAFRMGTTMPVLVADGAAPLILVAEDDPINRKVILRQLALLGLEADIACDGAEAFCRWQEGKHALLLADLHMPRMDGYALATAIRDEEARRSAGSRLPILALTANALRDEVSRARDIGVDGYLTKPIALARLAEALRPWLSDLATPDTANTASATNGSLRAIDTSVHEELIGSDQSAVREFLAAYRGVSVDLVARFSECVINGDSVSAATIAHRLKSSSRWIGARRFGDLCERLEAAALAGDTGLLASRLPDFQRNHADVLTEIERLCSLEVE